MTTHRDKQAHSAPVSVYSLLSLLRLRLFHAAQCHATLVACQREKTFSTPRSRQQLFGAGANRNVSPGQSYWLSSSSQKKATDHFCFRLFWKYCFICWDRPLWTLQMVVMMRNLKSLNPPYFSTLMLAFNTRLTASQWVSALSCCRVIGQFCANK